MSETMRPARTTPNLGLPVPGDAGPADYVTETGALADAIDALYAALLSQPGDIKASAAQNPTSGWLLCDGTALSRTVYATLFAAIGTAYGPGDGTTTFNIPDLRGRFPEGAPAPANVGAKGGESTHTLTAAEMPVHAHSVYDPTHAHSLADPGHYHGPGTGGRLWTGGGSSSVGGGTAVQGILLTGNVGSSGTGQGVYGASTGIGIFNAGSGATHNNLPPFQNVNYFIKT